MKTFTTNYTCRPTCVFWIHVFWALDKRFHIEGKSKMTNAMDHYLPSKHMTSPKVDTVLGQRRKWCTNIETMLVGLICWDMCASGLS